MMVIQKISTHLRQKWIKRPRSLPEKRDHLRRHLRKHHHPLYIYVYFSRARSAYLYREKKTETYTSTHYFFTLSSLAVPLHLFTYTYRFIKAIFILLSIFISLSLFIHLLLYCRHHLYRATRTQREGGSDKPADNALSVVYIYASLSLSSLSSSSWSSAFDVNLFSLYNTYPPPSLSLSLSLYCLSFRDKKKIIRLLCFFSSTSERKNKVNQRSRCKNQTTTKKK